MSERGDHWFVRRRNRLRRELHQAHREAIAKMAPTKHWVCPLCLHEMALPWLPKFGVGQCAHSGFNVDMLERPANVPLKEFVKEMLNAKASPSV